MLRKTEEFEIKFNADGIKESIGTKAWSGIYEWLDSLVYAVCLILLVFTFAFRVVGVNGRSMNPTLNHGDWLLVTSVTQNIKRGDIVITTQPNILNEPLVKRVIAKGGDTVDIDFDKHTVTVNGVVLDEPYIAEPTSRQGDFTYPMTVPDGYLFLMGDNRNDSTDSRFKIVGFIDERYVLGVAKVRVYPLGDWRLDNNE